MSYCSQFCPYEFNSYVCSNCLYDKQDHQLPSTRTPLIYILATGGTIAGVANDDDRQGTYQAGVLSVDVLLRAVPELSKIAEIRTESIASIDSKNMTTEVWNALATRVNQLLENDDVDGIVITHGTDTLEETAYLLYLTVKSNKPVVLTAAMRPSNALSADGPLNLLNAVVVAACEASRGQSVLVVMNGDIYSARDVTKTNTYSVDTFRSNEFGALGWIHNNKAEYQRSMVQMSSDTTRGKFSDADLSELPAVEIVASYTSPSRTIIDDLVARDVKGIVLAGTGDGTIHTTLEQAAIEAVQKGVAVVRSSRVCYGHVNHEEHDDDVQFLTAGTLNPWKARVLLMLILERGITGYSVRQKLFNSH